MYKKTDLDALVDGKEQASPAKPAYERHRTGFSAWTWDEGPLEFIKSGYRSLTMDGIGAGFVNHALNIAGLVTWVEMTRYLPPLMERYLPVAEYLSHVSVSPMPLGLDRAVEFSLAALSQGVEALISLPLSFAAGYLAFRVFDWLGDDYRPQKAGGWMWERTGGKVTGGIKTRFTKAKQRLLAKPVTPETLANEFEEDMKKRTPA